MQREHTLGRCGSTEAYTEMINEWTTADLQTDLKSLLNVEISAT